MRLQDKVCLITGGGKGIGAATAEVFCQEGAIVEIADVDDAASLELINKITEKGGEIYTSHVNVTDADSVNKWIDDVNSRHGKIDVLFNNAGISAVGVLHELDESLWDAVTSVNIKGVYLVSKAALPTMIKQGYGSIINMSSCIAEMGLEKRAAYAATKGAVLSMTKSMQVDYAPYNIRVNALMPGTIFTPFVEDYLRRSYDDADKAIAGLKKRQLGPELGTPEDVAYAALYLASDESGYVMGSGLKVDGGVTGGKPY
ncbi:NAD(P)-dependent dehydrogenase (short-subunit alcohol dehydrogenase family) [Scopulibacillus darangshiensis]|uniref:NAD(P)-dependent dehydrogenase (Short-subunit alcohol dehydrogenase family) n=1 Tax=Scopulibacillus darangshiensis TaxID=442528 RepID=A0A4R2P606_9BACL|nr:SDR family oxidoreductase [Scopulibacillus darangshiensis]TCP29648.1 NAD(P)-dependent dehydrogenase (short-subunit alcohol dehydrogenase family) [Scopulibacillus darangshiensis]